MKWLFAAVAMFSLIVVTGKIFNHTRTIKVVNEVTPQNIPPLKMESKKTKAEEVTPPPVPAAPSNTMIVENIASEDVLLPAARFNENRFRERLDNTPLKCERCMVRTARYLRVQDPKLVSKYFVNELRRIGSKDLPRRTRLVKLADALHSDDLLPFWKDLAYRETPLADSERSILSSKDPSPKSIRINEELTSSVENLGAIGFHDKEAKDILVDIINNPGKLHRSALRHRALLSLRDSDFSAAVKAVKKLPADDELRVRLKAAQKAN
ncbi:MAG: hypothetical protein EOP07_03655 [Proteobacteria bacterium]|nr:MAG: hypothetical protein EOP07_03655 [Pseudomonadota bacterium]